MGDYWQHRLTNWPYLNETYFDFRRDSTPNCGKNCSKVEAEAAGHYSDILFSWEAKKIIENHDESKPLFMYLAF